MTTLGKSTDNSDWQVFTILISHVLKSFYKNTSLLQNPKSLLVSGQTSKQYNTIGKHLLLINCKRISSDATRPTFPEFIHRLDKENRHANEREERLKSHTEKKHLSNEQ